jgi:flagellar hook protein FlgE
MFTALSGLTANARNLDVIGNNISNVNTTAYKTNRMLFSTQFSRNLSIGTQPSTESGGSNPGQVGLGVRIAGTQRDFSSGSISATGDARDLALEGNGFFIVNNAGNDMYTRAGSFRLNAENDLTSIEGFRVRGYAVDSDFNINRGTLVDLNIPVGTLTLAEATENVRFSGNLNAGGTPASAGSIISLDALAASATATVPPTVPNIVETTSLVSELELVSNPGTAIYPVGSQIRLEQAQKGTKNLPTASYTVTATSTLQDVMDFFRDALGINTGTGTNPDGNTPGVALDPATGIIRLVGNTGTSNDLTVDSGDIGVYDSSGTLLSRPFTPDKTGSANGESVRTTFVAYDSLGNPVSVDLTAVLESKTASGTTWRYFVDSPSPVGGPFNVGTGTVDFDSFGQIQGGGILSITLDRTGTGAVTPMQVSLNFRSTAGAVTALTDQSSTIAATYQDGTPLGTLASYAVGNDGVIVGAFTNGLSRVVGQVALATFSNPEGLVDQGNNLFRAGPNSGTAVVSGPLEFSAGRIVGGSLELSNVDLSQEFINLILASTGYSASSRVITTTDQLFQQLLVLGR